MKRVAAVAGLGLSLLLLGGELAHRDVEERDAATRGALVALRLRSSQVDVAALQTLLQHTNKSNFDVLTQTLDELRRYAATLSVDDPEVQKFLEHHRVALDARSKNIEKLKGARGRLINIEHYLPVHLDELRAAHPDDDKVVAVRSMLLAYLLDPSPARLKALQEWKNNVDPKDPATQHLAKTRHYLTAFSQARGELDIVTEDLGVADLASAADAVVSAEDRVVADHRARAEALRLVAIGLGIVAALLGLWWPSQRPRFLAAFKAR